MMNSAEQKALKRLQGCLTAVNLATDLTGWTVQTGKQGVYYLHTASGATFQTLAAAVLAVNAFRHDSQTCTSGTDADSEDDAKEEVLSIASCLDQVVNQLQKSIQTMEGYKRVSTEDTAQELQVLRPKIVDMYDVCSYVHVSRDKMVLKQTDTLLQRSTKVRCQLLLATCAVFTQKVLHRSSYTSGYRQHCMYTLLQELKRTGPDNPALSMLVEPLLPRAWRKELDKQKLLQDDVDTDLYSPAVAEQDLQGEAAEEGPPLEDDFVVAEDPGLLKSIHRVKKVSEALDLVPLYKRADVEMVVANAIGKGLHSMAKCISDFEGSFAEKEHHKDWLRVLKEAIADSETDEKGCSKTKAVEQLVWHDPASD